MDRDDGAAGYGPTCPVRPVCVYVVLWFPVLLYAVSLIPPTYLKDVQLYRDKAACSIEDA